MMGPFIQRSGLLSYVGNKIYAPSGDASQWPRPKLWHRTGEIVEFDSRFSALAEAFDSVHRATSEFMSEREVPLFNLPILTRMISSPGALTGTIPSDVAPFRVDFFGRESFLTQSSQLYLELALCLPKITSVYCWDKSFRNEKTDFRHLPEFTHVEFESKISFEDNMRLQEDYFERLLSRLLSHSRDALGFFLSDEDIGTLEAFCSKPAYEVLTFDEAFELLHKATGDERYRKPTIGALGPTEEVSITQLLDGKCVFVTRYPTREVAFYHASPPGEPNVALNADFLAPGYGELIGSGERLHTEGEIEAKAIQFKLSLEDYHPYVESRRVCDVVHCGWGMGIERFIQFVLKLPAIWEASVFPRVDGDLKP